MQEFILRDPGLAEKLAGLKDSAIISHELNGRTIQFEYLAGKDDATTLVYCMNAIAEISGPQPSGKQRRILHVFSFGKGVVVASMAY